ncbi:hypothetical protein EMIT07CA2_10802 [Brevibacillus sp. IT-7CA2]|uniref:hypothetical protein n=1 Tax=Brevibacillus sp. IT-7CA2 TaxID=3026436 RepID=UPI0039E0D81C
METIKVEIDDQLQAVPVLTLEHVKALSKIHTGGSQNTCLTFSVVCIEAGLVEETPNEFAV